MSKSREKLNDDLTDLTARFSATAVMLMRESKSIHEMEDAIYCVNRHIANELANVAVELDMADSADSYFDHCEATLVVEAERIANALRTVRTHMVAAPEMVQ